jgi:hypothetical protein
VSEIAQVWGSRGDGDRGKVGTPVWKGSATQLKPSLPSPNTASMSHLPYYSREVDNMISKTVKSHGHCAPQNWVGQPCEPEKAHPGVLSLGTTTRDL